MDDRSDGNENDDPEEGTAMMLINYFTPLTLQSHSRAKKGNQAA